MKEHTPCVFCGKTADDHHHYHGDRPASGKGMGGSHEHLPALAACRACHEAIHDRRLIVTIDGELARFERDGGHGVRALVTRGHASLRLENLPYLADEALAGAWADAESRGREAIVMQALIAYGFRQRYGWGERWYARVAEIIRDQTGVMVSPAVVYDRAGLGTLLAAMPEEDPASIIDALGMKAAAAVGKAGAAPELVDQALAMRDAGASSHAVAQAIRAAQPGEGYECEPEECDHRFHCVRCGLAR